MKINMEEINNMFNKNLETVIFDLDGTITKSRSLIRPDMSCALINLSKKFNLIIISGASKVQIKKQIPWIDNGNATVMAESGNDIFKGDTTIFKTYLNFDDVFEIMNHIKKIYEKYGFGDEVGGDRIEIRGGQVSWSVIGHNTGKRIKESFDPTGSLRRRFLEEVPFESEGLSVKIGGTTCLDYTKKDCGKKGNLKKLLSIGDSCCDDDDNKNRYVYFGDQLYKGGNDEEVKDIMECVEVKNSEETLKFIKYLYEKKQ